MNPPHEVMTVYDVDGGEIGWLVIDRLVGGLSFGGFRFSPGVTRGEVERLARCMTHKLALHGSPVGGAKAGLRCDPRGPDVEALLDRFAEVTGAALRDRVMLGRDMGATDALIDGLYRRLGCSQLETLGRQGRLRELPGYRKHMTGLGVAFAARRAAGGDLRGATVAIQGFGLVGAGSAIRLSDMGAKIVAVSDARGALLDPDGIDVGELIDASASTRALPEGRSNGDRDRTLETPCDILVLAASSESVDEALAARVTASRVVEGANFGLTDGARSVLHDRGIEVIPDLIASSSSAAMVARQMKARGALDADELWSMIESAIDEATGRSVSRAIEDGSDVRSAYLSGLACS